MSVTMISERAMIPPLPIPWRERPTSRQVKFSATPATTAPTKKNSMDVRTRGLRPKIFENDAKLGCKTVYDVGQAFSVPKQGCLPVEDSRKAVPHQKASMAVPFRLCEIVCDIVSWKFLYWGARPYRQRH
jgi:hypothetical protein